MDLHKRHALQALLESVDQPSKLQTRSSGDFHLLQVLPMSAGHADCRRRCPHRPPQEHLHGHGLELDCETVGVTSSGRS